MEKFTHFNKAGEAIMVDVSGKQDTVREALATGKITMTSSCRKKVEEGQMGKGDVLSCARIAGIMGAKRTSELIPLCHILNLTKVEITFAYESDDQIRVFCTVRTIGKTGVEMEALLGVNIALLTIYDMCKAVDKRMHIDDVHLCTKSGGKSGDFYYEG